MTPTPNTPASQQGYAEESTVYAFQIVLTSGQVLTNQKVPIDPDSDFLLRGIYGTSTGTYKVNMKMPRGNMYANVQIQSANFVGTVNQPAPVGPGALFKASGIGPALDITDTSGAGNTVEICFAGIRRYKTRM